MARLSQNDFPSKSSPEKYHTLSFFDPPEVVRVLAKHAVP